MQTCPIHIGKLNLHLCRRYPIYVSFNNILFARTCSLDHLIYGTVTTLKILVGEIVGNVVNYNSFLVAKQRGVVLSLTKEVIIYWVSIGHI